MKNKVRNVLAALVLCMSAVALPVTAYASTGSDTTPPTLTAALKDDKLAVEASDDMSGVEAVYVDDTRINSLVNGKGTVALKDYAGDGKEVTVYAVDYSGNRSKERPQHESPRKEKDPQDSAPKCSPASPFGTAAIFASQHGDEIVRHLSHYHQTQPNQQLCGRKLHITGKMKQQ